MWDVIVVGAGPAGASTAYFLAQRGVSVLLLDRQAFPRDKVCGDGVSAKGLAVLEQMGLAEWISQHGFVEPHTLLISGPDGSSVAMDYTHAPFCYGRVIPRRVLDSALVNQAAVAGAHLVENCHVRLCERIGGRGVRVSGIQAGRSWFSDARLLVLAEGSRAALSKQLGLTRSDPDLAAIRGYFAEESCPNDRLEIHYGKAISPGYAWIFPLGDGTANVGLGTFLQQVRRRLNLASELERIMAENPYFRQRLTAIAGRLSVKGFTLRTDLTKSRLYADHVVVVGEAAHLVNPLTGEGIAPALVSGQAAAEHIHKALERGHFSAAALASYGDDIRSRYAADHRAALWLRRLLSRPGVVNRIIRKARGDKDLALTLGLVIIGVSSPTTLLKPSMVFRYLL